jgi:hypothetical protein
VKKNAKMLLVALLAVPVLAVPLSPPISLQFCPLTNPLIGSNVSSCCTSLMHPFDELNSVKELQTWLGKPLRASNFSIVQLYSTADQLSFEFQPTFLAFARSFPTIRFARIASDAGNGQPAVRLSGFHMARGFPSVFIFKKKRLIASYTGVRTLEDLSDFAHRYSQEYPVFNVWEFDELKSKSAIVSSFNNESSSSYGWLPKPPTLAVWMWMWIWPSATQVASARDYSLSNHSMALVQSRQDDSLNRIDPLFYISIFFFTYKILHLLWKWKIETMADKMMNKAIATDIHLD